MANNLELIAEKRCVEPMNSWPQHNDFHRRNTHPFSGSRYGEQYFDEECLRCQLERAAAKAVKHGEVILRHFGLAEEEEKHG